MSSTYTGNPANNPTSYTLPSDGDGPGIKAADVNVPLEGLADKLAWLDARMLTRAVDFPTKAALPAGLNQYVRAKYRRNRWAIVGGQDWFSETSDPYNWPTATQISAGTYGTADLSSYDFDIAPDGSAVVVSEHVSGLAGAWDSIQRRTSAGVWSSASVGLSTVDAIEAPNVVYAPTAALWCIVMLRKDAGVAHPGVITSPDRVTWTLRTAPSGLPDADSNLRMTVSTDGAGVLVIQAYSGTNTYFSKSTDGGVTWSAVVTKALGFTAITAGDVSYFARPIWNGSTWMAFAANVGTIKVYTSADALTWTLASTIGAAGFEGSGITMDSLECFGDTFVGLVSDGTRQYLIYSRDAGVTWKRVDRSFLVTAVARPGAIAAGAERLLLVGNTAGAWPGSPVAPPSLAVT